MKIEQGTFAEACYNSNSIAELQSALAGDADKTDCEEWNITADEWKQSVKDALAAKLADKNDAE